MFQFGLDRMGSRCTLVCGWEPMSSRRPICQTIPHLRPIMVVVGREGMRRCSTMSTLRRNRPGNSWSDVARFGRRSATHSSWCPTCARSACGGALGCVRSMSLNICCFVFAIGDRPSLKQHPPNCGLQPVPDREPNSKQACVRPATIATTVLLARRLGNAIGSCTLPLSSCHCAV